MPTLSVPPLKIGVILGGGGSLGAFEVGPLKVIEEAKIPVDLVIGVSVGSINGASFVANKNSAKELTSVWCSFKKPSQIFKRRKVRELFKIKSTESLYRIEPLIQLISRLNLKDLVSQDTEFVATTARNFLEHNKRAEFIEEPAIKEKKKTVFFSNHDPEMRANPIKLALAILASSAIPGLFPSIPIQYRGELCEFYDGAFARPLPLQQAIKRGCNTLIAIRCHSDAVIGSLPQGWISRISYALSENHHRRERDEIVLVKKNEHVNLFVIEPESFPPTFTNTHFKKGDIPKVIEDGERIARRELAPLIEYYSTKSV